MLTNRLLPNKLDWSKIALLIIAAIAILTLALNFASSYGNFWIPWYKFILGLLENRFSIETLRLTEVKTETMFQLKLVVTNPLTLYGTSLPVGGDISAFTLLAHSLQHIIILSIITLATIIFCKVYAWRLIVTFLVSVLVLETLDIPLLLLGSINTIIFENLAPDKLNTSFLVWWVDFLNNGGRIALSVFAGLLVFEVGRKQENTE